MSQIIEFTDKNLPKDCYIFKHSTACPISFAAANEVKLAKLSLPLYWINVIEERPASNWVAETYKVTHQSPQLILIENGKVTSSWSHGEIKKEVFN